VTDNRLAFETPQHDHDAKIFRFATERASLTRQEFAEGCHINVLMAYGRCLRPALYSSLRSSPSHPTGVSALRVTIAIASARFARKQWGASQVNCQSRGGSFAMNRPPADVFEQALLDDPNCILSQIAASTESLLAWEVGPWEPATARQQEDKIKRAPVRLSLSRKKRVCTLACTGSGVVSKKRSGISSCAFSFSFNGATASLRYVYFG
jgi:hypothetical protein